MRRGKLPSSIYMGWKRVEEQERWREINSYKTLFPETVCLCTHNPTHIFIHFRTLSTLVRLITFKAPMSWPCNESKSFFTGVMLNTVSRPQRTFLRCSGHWSISTVETVELLVLLLAVLLHHVDCCWKCSLFGAFDTTKCLRRPRVSDSK